jgi:hypothetical protein
MDPSGFWRIRRTRQETDDHETTAGKGKESAVPSWKGNAIELGCSDGRNLVTLKPERTERTRTGNQ